MSVRVACPACGRACEIEDAMAGASATCDCGAAINDPSAASAPPRGAGRKSCPECGAVSAEESVLCVSCGYNFKTGGKIPESGGAAPDLEEEDAERPLSFMGRYGGLVKLGVAAVLLGVLAAAILSYALTRRYGISGGHPVGRLREIEAHLTAAKMVKGSTAPIPPAAGAVGVIQFWDLNPNSESSKMFGGDFVAVAVDADGNVCGVGGRFSPPGAAMAGTGSTAKRFLESFWEEAGCGAPAFKEFTRGSGRFSYAEQVAEHRSPSIAAKWSKELSGAGLSVMQASTDTLWVVRVPMSPDAMAKASPHGRGADDSEDAVPLKGGVFPPGVGKLLDAVAP